jgi:hypothetical protein
MRNPHKHVNGFHAGRHPLLRGFSAASISIVAHLILVITRRRVACG